MADAMLTTVDNPFNPFTQFEEWNDFDIAKGYNTNGYLARIARVSESLSEEELRTELGNAMNEIVEINGPKIYKIVTKEDFEDISSE